jgi:2-(1,2-epoxy-1,2-dihydrophenyl)acetyl-CoA isomerase
MTDSSPNAPVLDLFDPETGIGRILFNRPDVLNAINGPTAIAFNAAVKRTLARDGLRLVVLAGAGRAFVAGGDISQFQHTPRKFVTEILGELHAAVLALAEHPVPVLAVVQGPAAGAGLSLVLGADYVVASDQAQFLIAYDRIGASPDCGSTWFLERKVGRARAFELMLMSKVLDAEAAKQAGVVTEVVKAAELDDRAETVARKIAAGPTHAFGRFKRLINGALHTPLAQHLDIEGDAFLEGTDTDDFREGVDAFLNKRPAPFRGR